MHRSHCGRASPMQQHLVLSGAGRGARGDVPKVRGPDRRSAVSSAWHIQRCLLRAFRPALRCRARGVRRHREYAPLCSRHPPRVHLLRTPASRERHFWLTPADAITKDDIVRALEQGTSAELLVKDWDLSGTGQHADSSAVRVGFQPSRGVRAHRASSRRSHMGGAAGSDRGGSADGPATTAYTRSRTLAVLYG